MADISTGIKANSNFINLKPMKPDELRKEVLDLLVMDEHIISAFKTVRDQVIFSNKRIFVINVQGVTGKKVAYFSYPYSKVQYYGIETAGLLDIDCELTVAFSNGCILQFDFKSNVNIKQISQVISEYIL